jgi:hypothetical protein
LSPVELWEPSCKSNLLPVDRKYQKGQSRDNYTILLLNSKCKLKSRGSLRLTNWDKSRGSLSLTNWDKSRGSLRLTNWDKSRGSLRLTNWDKSRGSLRLTNWDKSPGSLRLTNSSAFIPVCKPQ